MTSEETLAELEAWRSRPSYGHRQHFHWLLHQHADSLLADSRELRRLRASLSRLEQGLRAKAITSRQEADRIRRTIKEPTDAEARCLMRAEDWELVADALQTLNSEVR